MTTLAKILSTIGLIMLYGFLSGVIMLGAGEGPNLIGTFLSIGLIAGIIAIWRSKPPINPSDTPLDKS